MVQVIDHKVVHNNRIFLCIFFLWQQVCLRLQQDRGDEEHLISKNKVMRASSIVVVVVLVV